MTSPFIIAGMAEIGHVLLVISPILALHNKIASEIAGYFVEKIDLAAGWPE